MSSSEDTEQSKIRTIIKGKFQLKNMLTNEAIEPKSSESSSSLQNDQVSKELIY